MRDSTIFYRSFYEAINMLPYESQGRLYQAVFSYALDGVEPELDGIEKTVFILIKPQLDANNKKFENGSKGGRPPKQKQGEKKPNNNLNKTKEEPKLNQTKTELKPNVNDNDNYNVNNNENSNEEVNENSTFHPAEISEIVNRIFGKDLTERKVPRFDRDMINNLITVNGYTKQEIINAWENAGKDNWHKSRGYSTITLSYLSETKTMERYHTWVEPKQEDSKSQFLNNQNGKSNSGRQTMDDRLEEAKRRAREEFDREINGSTIHDDNNFTDYTDITR